MAESTGLLNGCCELRGGVAGPSAHLKLEQCGAERTALEPRAPPAPPPLRPRCVRRGCPPGEARPAARTTPLVKLQAALAVIYRTILSSTIAAS